MPILTLHKEISRLEDELDYFEISHNENLGKDLIKEKFKRKYLERCEKFLEGIIYSVKLIDTKLAKCLGRGWSTYQRILNKKIRKDHEYLVINELNIKEKKEIGIQVEDIFDIYSKDQDFDDYIEILNSLIDRVSNMNHTKVVKSLQKLLASLKPIEIPDIVSSLSLPPLPLPDSSSNFSQKHSDYSQDPSFLQSRNKHGCLLITRDIQTELNFLNFSSSDTLKNMIKEREQEISTLSEKLQRLENIEKNFNNQQQELFDIKKIVEDLGKKPCRLCKENAKKIADKAEEIKELKQVIVKTETTEVELEKTKDKLKQSSIVIDKKNEKIKEITENLEDLKIKINETAYERKNLEDKLKAEEENIKTIEAKLKQSLNINKKLKTHLQSSRSNNANITNHSTILIDNPNLLPTTSNESPNNFNDYSLLEPDIKIRYKTPNPILSSKYHNEITSKNLSPNDSENSSHDFSNSIQPPLIKFKGNKNKSKKIKESKISMIMNKLNITKEEYLGLSKKARLELFEILLAHNKKCGPDCEHLKRAMMIKYKDKGKLYPTKKYNIVKE
ncbi:hypothetical protein SteCoe_14776 [Stentor coeruleus]|uniref:Uncharacterized protein n=1 Tax=Stentor coeruleus TaxID=5963 RepID=A0A1R2C594_9CILI|nr:hypothetical protein SteCoe_14776 [Stentor coeruleus]